MDLITLPVTVVKEQVIESDGDAYNEKKVCAVLAQTPDVRD